MTDTEMIDAILKYGIAIRQIPHEVVTYVIEVRGVELREGDTLVTRELLNYSQDMINKAKSMEEERRCKCEERDVEYIPYFLFDDVNNRIWKQLVRRVRIPNKAGWWMCKRTDNSPRIDWKWEEDNLAPTLQESLQLFLDKLE